MIEFPNNSLEDLQKIADSLSNERIFFLFGDMGMGKTQFVKLCLKNIEVQSPTFTVCNSYDDNIWHFDLYRIVDNFENIGLYDALLKGKKVFVEWSENFPYCDQFEGVNLLFEKNKVLKLNKYAKIA